MALSKHSMLSFGLSRYPFSHPSLFQPQAQFGSSSTARCNSSYALSNSLTSVLRGAKHRQREGIIGRKLYGFVGELQRQSTFRFRVVGPIVDAALRMTPCGHGEGGRVVRLELQGSLEKPQPYRVCFALQTRNMGQCLHVVVISVEIVRTFPLRPARLGRPDRRLDRPYDAARDLILEIEDVDQIAIEAVGPDVMTRARIDELARYANPVARLSHAPFQHVPHAQLAPNLADVDGPALVGERRVARDDEELR